MRPQTTAKGQLLTLDAVNVQHRSFAADQLHVRQILLNLLSNAVKYTPDGGMVALHVGELALAGGLVIGCATLAGTLQALRWLWEPWLAPWFGRLSDGPRGRGPVLCA